MYSRTAPGAGMNHSFMASVATALPNAASQRCVTSSHSWSAVRSVRILLPLAHAAVRAAVALAFNLMPDVPLFAGGKSFGGRMTSQAQAKAALPQVRGLIFLGFPLHPAKKPSQERAAHLAQVGLSDAVPAGNAR